MPGWLARSLEPMGRTMPVSVQFNDVHPFGTVQFDSIIYPIGQGAASGDIFETGGGSGLTQADVITLLNQRATQDDPNDGVSVDGVDIELDIGNLPSAP